MLAVLMTLALAHVERTRILPLPPKPLGLAIKPAEYPASLDLRLDHVDVRGITLAAKSNYELWCENGSTWVKPGYDAPRPPTRAKNTEKVIVGRGFGIASWKERETCCLPWQQYIDWLTWEKIDWLTWDKQGPRDVVWYTLVHEPAVERPFYVAEIDGLPYLRVRAKTVEDLEKCVLERFISYVESFSDLYTPLPQSRRSQMARRGFVDNSLTAGVSFEF